MPSEPPIASFDFLAGPQRGTRLTLYAARLLYQGSGHLESLTLGAIAAVRVAYQRDARKIGWGAALMILALVLLALFRPLAALAGGAAAEVAEGQAVAVLLRATLRILEAIANLMPLAAGGCLAGGVALIVFGWLGYTTLVLTLPAAERAYAVRGHNQLLIDFADLLAERAAQRGR